MPRDSGSGRYSRGAGERCEGVAERCVTASRTVLFRPLLRDSGAREVLREVSGRACRPDAFPACAGHFGRWVRRIDVRNTLAVTRLGDGRGQAMQRTYRAVCGALLSG